MLSHIQFHSMMGNSTSYILHLCYNTAIRRYIAGGRLFMKKKTVMDSLGKNSTPLVGSERLWVQKGRGFPRGLEPCCTRWHATQQSEGFPAQVVSYVFSRINNIQKP